MKYAEKEMSFIKRRSQGSTAVQLLHYVEASVLHLRQLREDLTSAMEETLLQKLINIT